MKKIRVNVKRLTMTVGVLSTAAGLLALAAWHKAPLAAFQPAGDPALTAAATPEEAVAIAAGAQTFNTGGFLEAGVPAEAHAPVDPVQDLAGDDEDLFGPKAGKHGPTDMAVAGLDVGDAGAPAAQPIEAAPLAAAQAAPPVGTTPVQAAQAAVPAVDPKMQPVADTPLEGGASVDEHQAASQEASAGPTPLVLIAAMDAPAPAAAPRAARRSAVSARPLGRVWRGEGAPGQVPPAYRATTGLVAVGEASYDGASRTLNVPVTGALSRRGLAIHQLGDGRAYVDLPWSKPSFSGSRAADVADGPLSRWVMAAHVGPGGQPETRVAFRLAPGAKPRLALVAGALQIVIGGHPVVATRHAAPATAPTASAVELAHDTISVDAGAAQAQPVGGAGLAPVLREARYDVAAGVLSIPVDGAVNAGALRFKRLDNGRAYLDVAGARPAFGGTRQAAYPGQALARWAMAGHETAGRPLTRVSFTLANPGKVDVRVADGEIRLTLPGHTGIRSAPIVQRDVVPADADPTPISDKAPGSAQREEEALD